MIDYEKELNAIEDEKQRQLMEIALQQRRYAEMLKSSMGQDIMDVLNGKVKVTLTEEEKKKNKTRQFWHRIKEFFRRWG